MNANNNLEIAESYYNYMLKKDFNSMGKFLHPEIQFVSPLKEMHGKQDVLDSATNLGKIIEGIKIRARFSQEGQVVLVYDFFFPSPINKLRSAVMMDFEDNMISRIELFFDAHLFNQK